MTSSSSAKYECKVRIDDFVLSSILSNPEKSLVGSIDNGTSSSRFLLITNTGKILSTAQVEYEQCFPSSSPYQVGSCAGWHEHDPFDIWDSVAICIVKTVEELSKHGLDLSAEPNASRIKAVGITNQRETTVAWNDRTGRVYYNAIVWDDTRTAATADTIMRENKQSDLDSKDALRSKTGLPIASYFAATKVRWLIDNISQLQCDLNSTEEQEHVRFGTMDTWILYQLTGYTRSILETENNERLAHIGGEFKTDVSNASRWLFMNLETTDWDESLVKAVCQGSACWKKNSSGTIPLSALPKIVPSADYTIGCIHGIPSSDEGKAVLKNVIVGSILGDQQAALFGQTCFVPGTAKCTYGTGLFLMMNTGVKPMPSTQGLLTTVAYQVGKRRIGSEESDTSPPVYALEGSVAFSGSTINWLRDRLDLIKSAAETEALALTVASNDNMYLVPAFSGLFAPHWRPDARGCMVGLTASHSKAHIVPREVFDAMTRDSNVELQEMRVDGGATANRFMMQFQADILDTPVVRPEYLETTAWGAGLAAGLAVGVWSGLEEIGKMWRPDVTWQPKMVKEERNRCWKGWNKAVERSLGWIEEDDD
ncbi:hypothetical protein ACHAWC_008332 [Mediolabrus comicus]